MFTIKQHHLFQLGLYLIGGLYVGSSGTCPPSDIIDGESKLIETVGFIFLKNYIVQVEAIVLALTKIEIYVLKKRVKKITHK